MKQKILAASIQLSRSSTGIVKMKDLMEVDWYVYHQDGTNPTEAEFNTFLAENWGWLDLKHDYVLKQVEVSHD